MCPSKRMYQTKEPSERSVESFDLPQDGGEWWVSLYQAEGVVDWSPWIDFLNRYTPQIYQRDQTQIVCELGRSRSMADIDVVVKRLQELSVGCPVGKEGVISTSSPTSEIMVKNLRIGQAPVAPEALVRARWGVGTPLESLYFWVSPFYRDFVTETEVSRQIKDLKLLGCRSLKDFLNLTESQVGSRWSSRGLLFWRLAKGIQKVQAPVILLDQDYEEFYLVPEEIMVTDLETLYFIAKFLFQKLEKKLVKQGHSVRSFHFVLEGRLKETARRGSFEFDLTLPAFYHDPQLWFLLLREKLQNYQRQERLPNPLESFLVRVNETISWQGVQKDLLDPFRETKNQSLIEMLARVEGRLGSGHVFWSDLKESFCSSLSWRRGALQEWVQNALSFGYRSLIEEYQIERATVELEVQDEKNRLYKRDSLCKKYLYQKGYPSSVKIMELKPKFKSSLGPFSNSPIETKVSTFQILPKRPLKIWKHPRPLQYNGKQILFESKWFNFSVVWTEIIDDQSWSPLPPNRRSYGEMTLEDGRRLWFYQQEEDFFAEGEFS